LGRVVAIRPEVSILQEFETFIGAKDPKTVRIYMTVLYDLIGWISMKPGGSPFHVGLLTQTAIKGYIDYLAEIGRAPRTRTKALSAINKFCRWAIDEGHMRRNPASQIERPAVINIAPRELSENQRYIMKNLVEKQDDLRLSAIFALAYWAGLRISEVATLKVEDCELNQRAGSITVRDSKQGKTRILDLHNEARRALYDYMESIDMTSPYIFTGQRAKRLRENSKPDNISERGIEHLWKKLRETASVQEWEFIKDIRYHDLRHDWAHRARAAGWSLEEIAVYLGHQTKDGAPAIGTTVRYTLPSRQQIKDRLQTLRG